MGGIFYQQRVKPFAVKGVVHWNALPATPFDVGFEIPCTSSITGYRSGPKWDNQVPLGSGEEILGQAIAANHYLTPFDNGHELDIVKRYTPDLSHSGKTISSPDGSVVYRPVDLIPSGASFTAIPDIDLVYYGTQFISQTRPKSAVELSSILAQAVSHQELPGFRLPIIHDRASFFRSLGPTYLNYEFGWKPFMSDLRSMMEQVLLSYKTLQQYTQDGQPGKTVRRKRGFVLPDVTTEDTTFHSPSLNGTNVFTGFFGNKVLWHYGSFVNHKVIISRKIWFSAEYAYTIDVGKDAMSRMHAYAQKATALLDLRITPEVLWELTPWTWLADWVGDIGSIIGNASAIAYDGLVIKYAYVMCESTQTEVYWTDDCDFFNYNPGTVYANFVTKRKQRVRSSPFGFGLNPQDFNLEQWGILAAIGMADNAQNLKRR